MSFCCHGDAGTVINVGMLNTHAATVYGPGELAP